MLSGREALQSIDGTVQQVRGQLQQAEEQIEATSKEMLELRQGQAEHFKSLARIRLDRMVSGKLVEGLATADRRVSELLAERVQSLKTLQSQIESNREELASLEQQRESLARGVEQVDQDFDRAEAATQQRLQQDAAYQTQLDKARLAGRTAEYAEEKTGQAEQNRTEKGQLYESDPLFAYLWKRKFGTSAYQASFLTRYLDKWVASLCDYHDARPNYYMLQEIPARLHDHADRVRADADREFDALKALETQVADADGLPALRDAVTTAEQRLDEADDAIENLEQRNRELLQQRGNFAAGEDDYFRQSLDTLADAFKRENLEALYRYARATPTAEDDMLVREIADAGRDVEQRQDTLAETRRMHERHLERLKELEGIRARFKRERYDDTHSGFKNGPVLALILSQFLQGMASSGDLWRTIERERSYRRTRADPTFGSGGFGRAGRSTRLPFPTSRGGFPGGGFGGMGGGGGSGGGFRTGGGF